MTRPSGVRSFGDELADLVNPAPQPELDPDAGIGEEGAGLQSVADEQLMGLLQQGSRQVGAAGGLGLRGALDLELDQEYRGRRSSRAALFGEEDDEDHIPEHATSSSSSSHGDGELGPEWFLRSSTPSSSSGEGHGGMNGQLNGHANGMNGHGVGEEISVSSDWEQQHDAGAEGDGGREVTQQQQQGDADKAAAAEGRVAGGGGDLDMSEAGMKSGGEEGDSDEDEEEEEDLEMEEEEMVDGFEQLLKRRGPGDIGPRADGSDGEEEEESEGSQHGEDEQADGIPGAGENPELLELERQYEVIAAEGAAALALTCQRSSKEVAKGKAIRAQRHLWDQVLHQRILVQKPVAAAAALPRPGHRDVLVEGSPRVAAGYKELLVACQELLGDMLQLHRSLAQLHPAAAAAAATLPEPPVTTPTAVTAAARDDTSASIIEAGGSRPAAAGGSSNYRDQKRSRETAGLTSSSSSDGASEACWDAVDAAVSAMAGFRDATVDKWHRRTVLSSGGVALKGAGLRALQQSISQQVAAAMAEPSKLIRRTQLPVGIAPRPLGSRAADAGAAALGDGGDGAVEGEEDAGRGGEERDVETYDDGDFYQQLLKELIDAGGAGGMAAGTQIKRRKTVDRRASKGRKIRYHVLDKLVNFMAPVDMSVPPFAAQLFSNLFGHKAGAAAVLQG